MDGKQLDLFDDVNDAPNEVAPSHALVVTMSFNRIEGDVTTYHSVTAHDSADYLDGILPVMLTFLHKLGYSYVTDLVAVKANGKEHSASA